jgi:hypothetical protein
MPTTVRPPAVAGQFYPGDPASLAAEVREYLAASPLQHRPQRPPPKALIVPHAGYVYSGPVAATAYACLAPAHAAIRRVVLLGPSHRVALRGMALCTASHYATPLGLIPLDQEGAARIRHLPGVSVMDRAHASEHSLEVHLPFLQTVLDEGFTLLPIVVGEATPEEVAAVMEALWGDEHTLIVVSSDLSHYHDYRTAQARDAQTSRAIAEKRYHDIGPEDACGCRPVNGLLCLAAAKGLIVEPLDVRNSGDTAGPRDRVVGYGAYAVH